MEYGGILTWQWFSLGSVIHLASVIALCIHCLNTRRETTSTFLWIFVAWSFPFIGSVLYLSFGIYRVPQKALRKDRADQNLLAERRRREDDKLPLAYWRSVHEALAVEPTGTFACELNKTMDGVLSDSPLLGGNRIRILVTGDVAFPLMLNAIRQARHHIHLQSFILKNDCVGKEFVRLLAEKAAQGVSVRLMYDRFGSTQAVFSCLFRKYRNVPNLKMVGWTQANPIKRQFQINLRNHRKLLVVDGEKAFTGGINLDSANIAVKGKKPIQDYHFAIDGPIVQELQYSFLSDWYYMTNDDPEVLLQKEHFPHLPPVGTALIRVVNSGPSSSMEAIADVFFTCIVTARKQLLAVTPYLVPTSDVLRALRSAALRGVDVRLVVPRKNNHLYAGMAGRGLYETLLTAGVRIFERNPPFMHAKAMIVDDTLALVGTANLDVRSLRLNYETNLAVYDDSFISELKKQILEEIEASDEIDLSSWQQRSSKQKLCENFCSLFAPML